MTTQVQNQQDISKAITSIRLSSVERAVLESVGREKKTVFDVAQDLNICPGLTQELLDSLVTNQLLHKAQHSYSLNNSQLLKIDAQGEIAELAEEVVNTCLGSRSDSAIGVQKFWLSPSDEKILRALLLNVERFISNIKKDHLAKKDKLSEQKVIFWGMTDYQKLIQRNLNA